MNARTPEAQVEAAARQAISHLERAAGRGDGGPISRFITRSGVCTCVSGDAAKAVDAFTRVRQPESRIRRRGGCRLPQAYAATDDLKNAIETLNSSSTTSRAWRASLAQYQEQAGLLKEATAELHAGARERADEPRPQVPPDRAAFNDGDYAQAAAFATEAQAQHPDDLRFPRLRARAIFESGDPARAVTILEPTAKAIPRDTATQLALADMYNDAGRDTDAERTLRQLLEWNRRTREALNYLGYLLADRGRSARRSRPAGAARARSSSRAIRRISTAWAGRISAAAIWSEAEKYLSPARAAAAAQRRRAGSPGRRPRAARPLAGRDHRLDARARRRRRRHRPRRRSKRRFRTHDEDTALSDDSKSTRSRPNAQGIGMPVGRVALWILGLCVAELSCSCACAARRYQPSYRPRCPASRLRRNPSPGHRLPARACAR